MGVAGRERVKRLFDVRSNASELQRLCDALLDNSGDETRIPVGR